MSIFAPGTLFGFSRRSPLFSAKWSSIGRFTGSLFKFSTALCKSLAKHNSLISFESYLCLLTCHDVFCRHSWGHELYVLSRIVDVGSPVDFEAYIYSFLLVSPTKYCVLDYHRRTWVVTGVIYRSDICILDLWMRGAGIGNGPVAWNISICAFSNVGGAKSVNSDWVISVCAVKYSIIG